MWFKTGGAIEFGQCMLEAGRRGMFVMHHNLLVIIKYLLLMIQICFYVQTSSWSLHCQEKARTYQI